MRTMTQEEQVLRAIEAQGGYATLRRLNEVLDFSSWKTKTPEASVRRIVQNSKHTFKIRPGLWALRDCQGEVMRKFNIQQGDRHSEEQFSHGYYQGLLVEIGKLRKKTTYVPAQDKNRLFIDKRLGDVADDTDMPPFTYERLLRKARTIDVVWFNERMMPADFFEVEHTTDFKNSLFKFNELQDFNASFNIVADKSRKREFEDKAHSDTYKAIASRVRFIDYERVAALHMGLKNINAVEW
ncbi:hypothetical protein [Hallella colorans]|uniref:hypothetical protein n=2 Tax=Hallella colorans TaxID=1703337 RepID=UPI0023F4E166|nr:hypothetical protein [Hallella colorans]